MIERLMDPERPYVEAEHSKLAEQIIRLKQQLFEQIGPEGKDLLEQLTDTYLNQCGTLTQDAFFDGFCSAVGLMLDYLKWNADHSSITNQQHPPTA